MGFFDDLVSQKKTSIERTGTFTGANYMDKDAGFGEDEEQVLPTRINPYTGQVYVSDADTARGMFGLTGYAPEETLHRTGGASGEGRTWKNAGVSFFGPAGVGAGSGHDLAHEITLTGDQGYRIKTDADKAGPASTSLLDDIISSSSGKTTYQSLKPDIDPRVDPNKPTQSASDASSSMPGDERVRGGTPFGRSTPLSVTRPDDYTGGLFDEYQPPDPGEPVKKFVPKPDTFVAEQSSRGIFGDYDTPRNITGGNVTVGDQFEVTNTYRYRKQAPPPKPKPKPQTTTFYDAEY